MRSLQLHALFLVKGTFFRSCKVYSVKTNKITAYFSQLPAFEVVGTGSELIYTEKYGLIAIGGMKNHVFYSLRVSATNDIDDEWGWKHIGSGKMNRKRGLFSTSMITDTKLICCGGFAINENAGYHNQCDIYNFETNEWTEIADLNKKRCRHAMHIDKINNKIYIGGGKKDSYRDAIKEFECYDIIKNKWYILNKLNHGHPRVCALWSENVNVLYIGSNYSNIVERMDLRENKWTKSDKYTSFSSIFGKLRPKNEYAKISL